MKRPISQNPDQELLMWRMVRALDIDVADAVRDSDLPVARLSSMIENCARCPEPGLCRLYLESRGDSAAEPPSFCPNRATLRRLRARRD